MAELHAPPTHEEHAADGPLRIERLTMNELGLIGRLNEAVFQSKHIINTFEREDLVMLAAYWDDAPAGFKIGYRGGPRTYYSAKGGVLERFRQRGIARALLYALMDAAREKGYARFAYDTFPNKHPGMTVLGLAEGFRVTRAGYNAQHEDYRLRFEKAL